MRPHSFSNPHFDANHNINLNLTNISNILNKIWGGKKSDKPDFKNNSELNFILDLIPDGVLISNQFGNVMATNTAYHNLTGYSKEEIIGKNASQIPVVEISDKMNFWSNTKNVLTRGEIDGFEFAYRHADGTTRWGEARAKLFRTGFFSGGAIAVMRDVTERKNKELILKQLNTELRRSNKELDDYTYAVSHDLKAPLRTIKSFSTFLQEDYADQLDEDGKMYIQRIMSATDHMKELIEDLLTFSRVGRMNTEVDVVDISELLEIIKLDLSSELNVKSGEIIYENLPTLSIQRIWLRQLLMNLISNGLKFNKSEKPKVWVTYHPTQTAHKFAIRDNGIGISPKHHERIFNIFERLHKQDEYPGTGAGLTICKKIVDFWGGRIWIESVPDGGSIFHFTIPNDAVKQEVVKDASLQGDELITEIGGNS